MIHRVSTSKSRNKWKLDSLKKHNLCCWMNVVRFMFLLRSFNSKRNEEPASVKLKTNFIKKQNKLACTSHQIYLLFLSHSHSPSFSLYRQAFLAFASHKYNLICIHSSAWCSMCIILVRVRASISICLYNNLSFEVFELFFFFLVFVFLQL